jgi:ABC-type glycerol-3-phosphate transport system substrate-binding protein
MNVLTGQQISRRTALKGAALLLAPAALAACGNSSPGTSGGKVSLNFWTHSDPPMVSVTKAAIASFHKAHPGISIAYTTIPNSEFFAKMLTSMTTGTGPDVFDMNDDNVRGDYIPRHLLAPVDTAALGYSSNAQLEAAYQPGALGGAGGSDGKVYGVPLELDSAGLAINTALFKKSGLDPADYPKTWDEVGSMGAKIAKATGAQGFNMVYLPGWALLQLEVFLLQTGGRVIGSDGKTSVINQAGGVQALEIWNKLVNVDHAGNAHTATRNSTVPYYDFSAGKQGMTIFFPWAVTQIQQQYPKMLDQMQIVPLPQVSPGTSHRFDYGYSWVVSAASSSDKQQAAWKFAGHLAAQHSQYLSGSGQVQPVTNWQESPAGKKMPFSSAWVKSYQKSEFFPVSSNWSQIGDIMQAAVENVVLNGKSTQSALNSAAQQIDLAMKQ